MWSPEKDKVPISKCTDFFDLWWQENKEYNYLSVVYLDQGGKISVCKNLPTDMSCFK